MAFVTAVTFKMKSKFFFLTHGNVTREQTCHASFNAHHPPSTGNAALPLCLRVACGFVGDNHVEGGWQGLHGSGAQYPHLLFS